MVHQNLWAGNVMLDKQGNALLADYGLSDVVAEEVMYATHKALAALGYLAPEYAYLGQVTEDCDIYAFGALILELVTGRRPVFVASSARALVSTAAWVQPLLEQGKVREFADPALEGRFSVAGAAGLAQIALQCMAQDPGARPNMVDLARRLLARDAKWCDVTAVDSFLATATAPSARPASFSHDSDALHPCR
jgi:serine/threonine protein kinase